MIQKLIQKRDPKCVWKLWTPNENKRVNLTWGNIDLDFLLSKMSWMHLKASWRLGLWEQTDGRKEKETEAATKREKTKKNRILFQSRHSLEWNNPDIATNSVYQNDTKKVIFIMDCVFKIKIIYLNCFWIYLKQLWICLNYFWIYLKQFCIYLNQFWIYLNHFWID